MIAKTYNCKPDCGEIEISFSKQDLGIKDVIADCDYFKQLDGSYQVCIFLGLTTYEELKEYTVLTFICNYSELKEKIVSWWKNHLKEGAAENIVKFVQKFTYPVYVTEIAEICKIFQVTLSSNERYEVEVYKNKTIYFDTCLERKYLFTFNESHSQGKISKVLCEMKKNMIIY